MTELATRERLQPSLLDRLTDDEPDANVEARERRVMSLRTLRDSVLRDLGWLLNTTNLFSTIDGGALPYLSGSVVNYGMPDISGITVAGLNLADMERGIRQAIWDFEPRLIRASVSVRAVSSTAHHNKITFEIEADMWAQPYPERLYLKTELDVERGTVRLREGTGA
jgi:type VI secretion system protein ImpF